MHTAAHAAIYFDCRLITQACVWNFWWTRCSRAVYIFVKSQMSLGMFFHILADSFCGMNCGKKIGQACWSQPYSPSQTYNASSSPFVNMSLPTKNRRRIISLPRNGRIPAEISNCTQIAMYFVTTKSSFPLILDANSRPMVYYYLCRIVANHQLFKSLTIFAKKRFIFDSHLGSK